MFHEAKLQEKNRLRKISFLYLIAILLLAPVHLLATPFSNSPENRPLQGVEWVKMAHAEADILVRQIGSRVAYQCRLSSSLPELKYQPVWTVETKDGDRIRILRREQLFAQEMESNLRYTCQILLDDGVFYQVLHKKLPRPSSQIPEQSPNLGQILTTPAQVRFMQNAEETFAVCDGMQSLLVPERVDWERDGQRVMGNHRSLLRLTGDIRNVGLKCRYRGMLWSEQREHEPSWFEGLPHQVDFHNARHHAIYPLNGLPKEARVSCTSSTPRFTCQILPEPAKEGQSFLRFLSINRSDQAHLSQAEGGEEQGNASQRTLLQLEAKVGSEVRTARLQVNHLESRSQILFESDQATIVPSNTNGILLCKLNQESEFAEGWSFLWARADGQEIFRSHVPWLPREKLPKQGLAPFQCLAWKTTETAIRMQISKLYSAQTSLAIESKTDWIVRNPKGLQHTIIIRIVAPIQTLRNVQRFSCKVKSQNRVLEEVDLCKSAPDLLAAEKGKKRLRLKISATPEELRFLLLQTSDKALQDRYAPQQLDLVIRARLPNTPPQTQRKSLSSLADFSAELRLNLLTWNTRPHLATAKANPGHSANECSVHFFDPDLDFVTAAPLDFAKMPHSSNHLILSSLPTKNSVQRAQFSAPDASCQALGSDGILFAPSQKATPTRLKKMIRTAASAIQSKELKPDVSIQPNSGMISDGETGSPIQFFQATLVAYGQQEFPTQLKPSDWHYIGCQGEIGICPQVEQLADRYTYLNSDKVHHGLHIFHFARRNEPSERKILVGSLFNDGYSGHPLSQLQNLYDCGSLLSFHESGTLRIPLLPRLRARSKERSSQSCEVIDLEPWMNTQSDPVQYAEFQLLSSFQNLKEPIALPISFPPSHTKVWLPPLVEQRFMQDAVLRSLVHPRLHITSALLCPNRPSAQACLKSEAIDLADLDLDLSSLRGDRSLFLQLTWDDLREPSQWLKFTVQPTPILNSERRYAAQFFLADDSGDRSVFRCAVTDTQPHQEREAPFTFVFQSLGRKIQEVITFAPYAELIHMPANATQVDSCEVILGGIRIASSLLVPTQGSKSVCYVTSQGGWRANLPCQVIPGLNKRELTFDTVHLNLGALSEQPRILEVYVQGSSGNIEKGLIHTFPEQTKPLVSSVEGNNTLTLSPEPSPQEDFGGELNGMEQPTQISYTPLSPKLFLAAIQKRLQQRDLSTSIPILVQCYTKSDTALCSELEHMLESEIAEPSPSLEIIPLTHETDERGDLTFAVVSQADEKGKVYLQEVYLTWKESTK